MDCTSPILAYKRAFRSQPWSITIAWPAAAKTGKNFWHKVNRTLDVDMIRLIAHPICKKTSVVQRMALRNGMATLHSRHIAAVQILLRELNRQQDIKHNILSMGMLSDYKQLKHQITPLLWSLQWRPNDHDGISNHQPECLISRLLRRRSKKTSKKTSLAFVRGIHRCLVNLHKGPVMRKMFPFDEFIMVHLRFIATNYDDIWAHVQIFRCGIILHIVWSSVFEISALTVFPGL